MDWFGWIAFIIVLSFSGLPDKVKRMERRIKKLEIKQNGGNKMSDMINSLKGQKCILKFNGSFDSFFGDKVTCTIIETDNDWVKISYQKANKKSEEKTINKIVRIEDIENIELCE